MTTERWVNTHQQDHLKDGSWVNYVVGQYDARDIMSDCVKPDWTRSGEVAIEIIPAGKNHSSDWDFKFTTDKDTGNRIAYSIRQGKFSTCEELKTALRQLGKSMKALYTNICGHESMICN